MVPLLPLVSIVCCVVLMAGSRCSLGCGSLLGWPLGLGIYFFYSRKRIDENWNAALEQGVRS